MLFLKFQILGTINFYEVISYWAVIPILKGLAKISLGERKNLETMTYKMEKNKNFETLIIKDKAKGDKWQRSPPQ